MQNLRELLGARKRGSLMVIFPHPDDEAMATGGLLIAAHDIGWRTCVVTLTKGGAGKVHINSYGKSTSEIRSEELEQAARVLKVDELVIGDFSDGKLRSEQARWETWVKKQILGFSPDIIVTYDHSGITGHPDHISLSLGIKEILNTITKPPTLLWSTLPVKLAHRVVDARTINYLTKPSFILDLQWSWVRKWLAVKKHASQRVADTLPIPLILALALYHYEWYHKVDLNRQYPYKFVEFKI